MAPIDGEFGGTWIGANQLGLTLIRIDARSVAALPQAFTAVVASGANAIYFFDDATLTGNAPGRKQVSECGH